MVFPKRINLGSVGQEFRKSFLLWNLEYVIILPKEDITGWLVSSIGLCILDKNFEHRSRLANFRVELFSYPLVRTCVLVAQKNI